MKQLTGRKNYREFTKWHATHQKEWVEDIIDYEKDPDLLTQPKYAARSAAYFWVGRSLAEIADRGATKDEVDNITKIVNRGTDSLEARVANFDKIYSQGNLN